MSGQLRVRCGRVGLRRGLLTVQCWRYTFHHYLSLCNCSQSEILLFTCVFLSRLKMVVIEVDIISWKELILCFMRADRFQAISQHLNNNPWLLSYRNERSSWGLRERGRIFQTTAEKRDWIWTCNPCRLHYDFPRTETELISKFEMVKFRRNVTIL